jgi:hypothetical protein
MSFMLDNLLWDSKVMFGGVNGHTTALFKSSLLDDTCGCSATCFGLNRPSSGAKRIYDTQQCWYVKTFLELTLEF